MKSMFKDPVLQTLSNSYKITDIESTQSVFHDLISCIVEQQIHYRSSKKTFEKMKSKKPAVVPYYNIYNRNLIFLL